MATKTLKSLERGLDLLLLFSRDRPVLSLHDISQALDIPQSSAYRLLATCRKKNVIVRDPRTKKYALDAGLLRLQAAIRAHFDITRVAVPHLDDLAVRSGETSQLFLLQRFEVICTEAISSPNMIRFMPEKGKDLPLHAPAAGRAVLAFLSDEFLATYIRQKGLRAMTPYTITDPEVLRAILAEIRKKGFALSFQQMYMGARGVAVPIFNHDGAPVGSLCVSGPDPRFDDTRALQLVPPLQLHARQLSAALGDSGDKQSGEHRP
jgi:IclR family acetate operon transcriptional repressor